MRLFLFEQVIRIEKGELGTLDWIFMLKLGVNIQKGWKRNRYETFKNNFMYYRACYSRI